VAAIAAVRFVTESRNPTRHGYDIPGAITVTGGLLALVYAFTKAGLDGWASTPTLTLFGVAGVLLTLFILMSRGSRTRFLPLRIIIDRKPGRLLPGVPPGRDGDVGTFLSLTYYFQGTLHYSGHEERPGLRAVLARRHHGGHGGQPSAPPVRPPPRDTRRARPRGDRTRVFTLLGVHTTYTSLVLPAELIVSFGMGLSFVALSSTSLIGVTPADAGVGELPGQHHPADGQLHGCRADQYHRTGATASYLAVHGTSAAAEVAGSIHGYTTAFAFSAIVLATAAVSAFALVRAPKGRHRRRPGTGWRSPPSDPRPLIPARRAGFSGGAAPSAPNPPGACAAR